MSLRFVILHHLIADSEHWDLMIEHDGVLCTWQLAHNPLANPTWPIEARRIGDHRLAYLDYEGPVSRNRGKVTRVERGHVEWELFTAERSVVVLDGGHLIGRYQLVLTMDDRWQFEAPTPTEPRR